MSSIQDQTGIDPGFLRRDPFRIGGVTLAGLTLGIVPRVETTTPATDPPGMGCRAVEKQVYVAQGRDPVMAAAREIVDFKTVAEQGICSGQVRSIIDPELGAHMRREAIRFTDELRRATGPAIGSSATAPISGYYGFGR